MDVLQELINNQKTVLKEMNKLLARYLNDSDERFDCLYSTDKRFLQLDNYTQV